MKGLLLFASVAFCLVAGVVCQDQCATTINGVSFPNLANLRNTANDYMATDASGANYMFNFCGQSVQYPNCAGIASSENCQNPTGNSPKSCGVSTSATRSAVVSKSTNSVTFTWIGGSPSGSCVNNFPVGNGQYSRVTNITVVCAPSEPTTVLGLVTELAPTPPSQSPTCVYVINAKSQYACPKSGGGGNGGDKNKEGISGGSIFLIIISCLAFVYVAGGMIFNWQKYDASGWELCPNREFWSEFGGLIKGGAVFTWSKITGNAPSASYESVE